MSKPRKLRVLEVGDIPVREVSGLALQGSKLLAVGDRDPIVLTAPLGPWPLTWNGADLTGLALPDRGTQFEAIEPVDEASVLILQEQPARVLHLDVARRALLGTVQLEVPGGHRLREGWLGDSSSRGESLILADRGHLHGHQGETSAGDPRVRPRRRCLGRLAARGSRRIAAGRRSPVHRVGDVAADA